MEREGGRFPAGIRRIIVAVVALCGLAVLVPGPARALVTRYVATPADGGSDALGAVPNTCVDPAQPCATIQHAVAVAIDGDTVAVGPGTFPERVTVPAPGVIGAATTMSVVGSPQHTIVNGVRSGSVFTLRPGTSVTLSRLLITGGGGPAQSGGGISNAGSAIVRDVTVSDNETGLLFGFGEGGGITNDTGATLALGSSTIADNTAFGGFSFGGGILNRGTLIVEDTTIAGNSAGALGGGVSSPGTTSMSGTIVSGNTGGFGSPNCEGTISDLGHNLDDGTSCGFGAGSLSSTDPALQPLADDGGPTPTMALGASSPAVNAGATTCSATDQRGVPRPQPAGGSCDIGAYEYAPGVVTGVAPASGPAAGGTSVTVSGHGFTLASGVTFGSVPATTMDVIDDRTIIAVSPPGTGAVPVGVITPDGSGPDAPASTFTYVDVHATSLTANASIAHARFTSARVYLKLSARLVDAETESPISGQEIVFSIGGQFVCAARTLEDGSASCGTVVQAISTVRKAGYEARFAGAPGLAPSSARGRTIIVGSARV